MHKHNTHISSMMNEVATVKHTVNIWDQEIASYKHTHIAKVTNRLPHPRSHSAKATLHATNTSLSECSSRGNPSNFIQQVQYPRE
jgi:hypothetical protein